MNDCKHDLIEAMSPEGPLEGVLVLFAVLQPHLELKMKTTLDSGGSKIQSHSVLPGLR